MATKNYKHVRAGTDDKTMTSKSLSISNQRCGRGKVHVAGPQVKMGMAPALSFGFHTEPLVLEPSGALA